MSAEILAWAWSSVQDKVLSAAADAVVAAPSKIAAKAAKKTEIAWQKLGWNDAETAYRQKLLSLIRSTKVLGNSTPIDIDRIYTDVYLYDKPSAMRRYAESLDEDEVDVRGRLEDRDRIEAKSLIKAGQNALILGRPGAGKTTFLKYLAMNACKGLIERTPIFVSLKDWSDAQIPLSQFIAKQFDICQFPSAEAFIDAILHAGKALILLDGLDEVNEWQDKRVLIIKDIVNFSNKYSKNLYFLTCRTAATDYSFDRFQYVEVADFSPDQQDRFVRQWYGAQSGTLEKFMSAWKDSRNSGFRDLGRTPLLLTLICLAYDESHAFPSRQVDLYSEAINALLKKWDTSRLIDRDTFYKELSYGQRQQLLETIASTFYFNSRTVFRKSEVAKEAERFISCLPDVSHSGGFGRNVIDGIEVVRQIEAQHGLIVERAHDLYTFSHLTIQEYFTACYIAKNQNANLLRQIIKSALNDQKWREVMLYTVALLPNSDSVLEEVSRQLVAMKYASTGVLIFLAHCYCDSRPGLLHGELRPSSSDYYFIGLKAQIEAYIDRVRQPPLAPAELTKFTEHIEVLHTFLRARSEKVAYRNSYGVIQSALSYLKKGPREAERLLGGYFIKPEQFINFFYACRLFMECLEVAITSKRDSYLNDVLELSSKDRAQVESIVVG